MPFPVNSVGCQQVKRAVLFAYFHSTYCLQKRNNTLKGRPNHTWNMLLSCDIFSPIKEVKALLFKFICAHSFWLRLLIKSFPNCKGIRLCS